MGFDAFEVFKFKWLLTGTGGLKQFGIELDSIAVVIAEIGKETAHVYEMMGEHNRDLMLLVD